MWSAGCSRVTSARDAGGAGGTAPTSDAGAETDASTGGTCTTQSCAPDAGCNLTQLPLIVDRQGTVPTRLHAPIHYQGAPAVLLVDTGSNLTFLQEPLGSPDPNPDAGVFQIGCLTLDVLGRPVIPDGPVNGLPSVGTLGTDLLLNGPTQIDLAGAQILFHAPGAPFASASGWPTAPFDLLSGAIVPHVQLNGSPVRLILDTGSQDTLWVGQAPQPGDVEVDAQDAYGNAIKLYLGTVDLGLGTAHVTVPVLRAPSFPSFQPPAKDIVGLLGLSSLGTGVVFDTDTHVVRVDL
jgi:hypothetical protein